MAIFFRKRIEAHFERLCFVRGYAISGEGAGGAIAKEAVAVGVGDAEIGLEHSPINSFRKVITSAGTSEGCIASAI